MASEQKLKRATFVVVVMLAIGVAAFAVPEAEAIDIDIVGDSARCAAEPDPNYARPGTEVCFNNRLEERIYLVFPPGEIEGGVLEIYVDPGRRECVVLSLDSGNAEFEFKILDSEKEECSDPGDRPKIIIDRERSRK
jgi:hypothetical protein